MFKYKLKLIVLAISILTASPTSKVRAASDLDCYAALENDVLTIGNKRIARQFQWNKGDLKTISITLSNGPLELPNQWKRMVGNPNAIDGRIVDQINTSIERGRPLGDDGWMMKTAGKLGLESTIRPRGRPRKEE